jgi:hypothetical protein
MFITQLFNYKRLYIYSVDTEINLDRPDLEVAEGDLVEIGFDESDIVTFNSDGLASRLRLQNPNAEQFEVVNIRNGHLGRKFAIIIVKYEVSESTVTIEVPARLLEKVDVAQV